MRRRTSDDMPVVLTIDELVALRFAADSAKNDDDNRLLHGIVRRARIKKERSTTRGEQNA